MSYEIVERGPALLQSDYDLIAMKDQASRNYAIALRDADLLANGCRYPGIAYRGAIASHRCALEALQVAHLIAFRKITGKGWSDL